MNHSRAPEAAAPPALLTPADRRLLDGCLAGVPEAWGEFVDRFAGLFAHVASGAALHRGIALSPADRDDMVAEVLHACLRNDAAVLRGFAGRASLPTYLTVVARRIVVRALGRQQETTRHETAAAAAGDPRRGDATSTVADREHVEALLHRLDSQEARVVRLHHLEGRSYGEISRLTGMPLGSIGPMLSRAKAKMRG